MIGSTLKQPAKSVNTTDSGVIGMVGWEGMVNTRGELGVNEASIQSNQIAAQWCVRTGNGQRAKDPAKVYLLRNNRTW